MASTGASLLRVDPRDINVGKSERVASALAGGSLLAYGIARGGVPGAIASLLGGTLVYRGVSGHCEVNAALGRNSARRPGATRLRQAVTIEKPADELYRAWRRFEELPRFLDHLLSVTWTGPGVSHWVARGLAGRKIEWDARITSEEEGRFLAWESLPGSDLTHSGSVVFRTAPGARGTEVDLEVLYTPAASKPVAALATLFGKGARELLREDLRRFKRVMEAGELPTTEGQPSGREKELARRAGKPTPQERAEVRAAEPWAERELVGVPS